MGTSDQKVLVTRLGESAISAVVIAIALGILSMYFAWPHVQKTLEDAATRAQASMMKIERESKDRTDKVQQSLDKIDETVRGVDKVVTRLEAKREASDQIRTAIISRIEQVEERMSAQRTDINEINRRVRQLEVK